MKKSIYKITAFFLSIVVLTSLCSCVNIKELRRSQGYYLDENKKSILFNGKTYDRMEDWDDNINVFLPNEGSVSEKDKPILIASLTGNSLYYNEAEIIIRGFGNYYCLREEYDNMQSKISNLKLDNYCVRSWYGDGLFEDIEEEIIILDSEYQEALNDLFKTAKPIDAESFGYEIDEFVTIYKCDETKTFYEDFGRIMRNYDGQYYVETYGYSTENDEWVDAVLYRILPSQSGPFKRLIDSGNNENTHKYYY